MEQVYEKSFVVERLDRAKTPDARESSMAPGGHLDGCRVGFDLGSSDYKLAAANKREPAFTTQTHWYPRAQSGPDSQFPTTTGGLKPAAKRRPGVEPVRGR